MTHESWNAGKLPDGCRIVAVAGVALPATPHPLLSSPTLYERTGDVKDANTMLVNRGELRAALDVIASDGRQP
jgi:hypothetical protein